METIDEMQNMWGSFNNEKSLSREELKPLIKSRIKKEKNAVAQYAIASWVWQFIVYVFLVRALIDFWGDPVAVGVCISGLVLYVQFTIRYARFCAVMLKSAGHRTAAIDNVSKGLNEQRENIAGFFRFKKRFDLIGIPVLGIIIITLFETLDWIPSIIENPVPSLTLFTVVTGSCAAAAYLENRKRFILPLEKLSLVQEEITRLEA